MTPRKFIVAKEWPSIETLAREAVDTREAAEEDSPWAAQCGQPCGPADVICTAP